MRQKRDLPAEAVRFTAHSRDPLHSDCAVTALTAAISRSGPATAVTHHSSSTPSTSCRARCDRRRRAYVCRAVPGGEGRKGRGGGGSAIGYGACCRLMGLMGLMGGGWMTEECPPTAEPTRHTGGRNGRQTTRQAAELGIKPQGNSEPMLYC